MHQRPGDHRQPHPAKKIHPFINGVPVELLFLRLDDFPPHGQAHEIGVGNQRPAIGFKRDGVFGTHAKSAARKIARGDAPLQQQIGMGEGGLFGKGQNDLEAAVAKFAGLGGVRPDW